ncbi:hypothetical protein ACIOKD_41875 [Streptomyces sp. NPDC087844]|uniref:hypothetical protein n=1 Tax=Streptomyces sp. NPDC087844 TaxID=3365805 RepID=UPI0038127041
MINEEAPGRLAAVVGEKTLAQAGVVFMPLASRQYLRDLARFRLLLASTEELSSRRADALTKWWHRLSEVMTLHQRAMSDVFWSCLHSKGPQFDSVVNSMHLRYETLGVSRTDAGRRLISVLKLGESPQLAQISFIRFQEEVADVSFWENREVIPPALRCFTPGDWRRVESYVLAVQAAQGNLGHVLPWLLDGVAGEESQEILSAFPAGMAHIYHSEWLPEYRRCLNETWPHSSDR